MREGYMTGKRQRCPVHPGTILRDDVLPALGMSVSGAAGEMKVSRQTLHRLMRGQTAVTPEMAVRLGKFCGNGAGIWLRMQQAHDLWHAENQLRNEISTIKSHRLAA